MTTRVRVNATRLCALIFLDFSVLISAGLRE